MSWALNMLGLGSGSSPGPDIMVSEPLEVDRGDEDLLVTANQAVYGCHDITLFNFDIQSVSKDGDLLKQFDKNYKIWNHPNIIKFITSRKTSRDSLCVVTERVEPLKRNLQQMAPQEVCLGLHSVATALNFLHKNGQFSHNDISMDATFVTVDGQWKLGHLECGLPFKSVNTSALDRLSILCDPSSVPPEAKDKSKSAGPAYARDMYGLGSLCTELMPYLEALAVDVKSLETFVIDHLLHEDPTERPTASQFLEQDIFKEPFVDIFVFLKNIPLKSEEEKDNFFRNLYATLQSLPEKLIAKHLAKSLLSRFSMTSSLSHLVLPYLIIPKLGDNQGLVSSDLFSEYIIPLLVKLFTVHEFAIRELLLKSLPHYGPLIPKETLQYTVLPEVLLGLHDAEEEMVQISLDALSHLVSMVGHEVVIGTPRQNIFIKTSSKSSPKQPAYKSSNSYNPVSNDMRREEVTPSETVDQKEQRRKERQEKQRQRKLLIEQKRKDRKIKTTKESSEIAVANSLAGTVNSISSSMAKSQDDLLLNVEDSNNSPKPRNCHSAPSRLRTSSDQSSSASAEVLPSDDGRIATNDDGMVSIEEKIPIRDEDTLSGASEELELSDEEEWASFDPTPPQSQTWNNDGGVAGNRNSDGDAVKVGKQVGDSASNKFKATSPRSSDERTEAKSALSPNPTSKSKDITPPKKGVKLVSKKVIKPKSAAVVNNDFDSLDIKNLSWQTKSPRVAEDNWFDEMEPAIAVSTKKSGSSSTPKLGSSPPGPSPTNLSSTFNSVLSFQPDPSQNDEDGWGDNW